MSTLFKVFLALLLGGLLVFGLIQLIPYGRDHTNPPVTQEPAWDSPETRNIVAGACFDCHSNETHWTWYSNIAPVSWLVSRDVREGRRRLNFSEWDKPQRNAGEAAEVVQKGEMPLRTYQITHPRARLTTQERQVLAQSFQKMFGSSGEGAEEGED